MTANNKHITIMVADDEEIVLSLVHDAMEDEGYVVLTSIDSSECLAEFDKQKIDLLISDIRMPNMNGIELVKRAREKQPDIQVIFMTGYANLNSAKEAIKQGASDYILKPFELHEIRQAVTKAVSQIERDAQATSTEKQLDNLTNFNELLFSGRDKIAQIQTSLNFAVTHCKAQNGSFLFWNSDHSEFKMISVNDGNLVETDLETDILKEIVTSADFSLLNTPILIDKNHDHPLYPSLKNESDIRFILPEWKNDDTPMVLIRVSRAESNFGFLMIDALANSETKLESNIKFLSITAHQLAMSLENLELLEESQEAYKKLRELQDETIQLEKMASRGEMSAEIGHELNNFLGVVVGSLSMLEHHLKNKNYEKVSPHMTAMQDNIDKIKKFTSNLMELRPIATKTETICFNKLLSEVVDYLKPQKRYRDVEIKFKPNKSFLPFEADSLHIQQMLYNLFNNAADALLDRKTKEIHVSLNEDHDNNIFNLQIQDTGIGIKPEHLEKAFNQKFTTKKTGHGFGLLVCKRIIESHQGQLDINSKYQSGTTINISFPIKNQVAQPTPVLSN